MKKFRFYFLGRDLALSSVEIFFLQMRIIFIKIDLNSLLGIKMKPSPEKNENFADNLPTLVTIICHLMTCYAMHPCEEISNNINRHLNVLLSSNASIELGEWKSTFIQLQIQWDAITRRYQQKKNRQQRTSKH